MGKRIFQYPEVTELAEDDYIMIDSEADDTRCILASKIAPTLMSKTVTERKVYTASEDGVKGYFSVSVEVPYTNVTDLEGDIVTFDDGEDLPLAGLKISIEPIQSGSGDPYPPGGGKNKFDKDSIEQSRGYTSSTHTYQDSQGAIATGFIEVTEGITLTISGMKNWGTAWVNCFVDENKNYISTVGSRTGSGGIANPVTVTVPSGAKYLAIECYTGSADYTQFQDKDTIQVELGSTATDYAPYSNIRPISGFTEGNVSVNSGNWWDEEWELGSIGGTGQPVSSNTNVRSVFDNPIRVVPSTTYYMVKPSVKNEVFFYKKDGTFLTYTVLNENTHEFSTPSECSYIRFLLYSGYGTTYNNDISINYPSTDTSYHAYNGHTTTISWEDEVGTVYGGTLDVVSGVLTVDRVIKTLDGSETYTLSRSVSDVNVFKYANSEVVANPDGEQICNRLIYNRNAWGGGFVNTFVVGSGELYLALSKATITSVEDCKQWIANNNLQLVYELATPTTYQLSPTAVFSLLGDNNVWANCGKSLVSYQKTWIQPDFTPDNN